MTAAGEMTKWVLAYPFDTNDPCYVPNLKLPTTVGEVSVKIINPYAFDSAPMTSVIIPEGIELIRFSAFSGAKMNLVSLPSTLKTMEEEAFNFNPSLKTVIFKEGLESIGSGSFYETGITSVTIPTSVKTIGDDAFNTPSLSTINLKGRTTLDGMTLGTNWNGSATVVFAP